MPNSLSADIAVIGSGFAGSLTALVLKKLGFTVVMLDKSTHPRFAIGESSTPIGNLILGDLAKKYDLPWLKPMTVYGLWQEYYPHLRVGRKRGFSYFKHERQQPFKPHRDHANELLVAASKDNDHSDTHWFRADVDSFFFKEAKREGVMCYENTIVERVRQGSTWTLSCKQGNNMRFDVKASFVIDATGRTGALAHFLKIPSRVESLRTNTRALFAHIDGLPSWHNFLAQQGMPPQNHPYYCDDAAVHHLMDDAWVWMLRFSTGRTSAGIVLDESRQRKKGDFESIISEYPSLLALFDHATFAPTTPQLIKTGRLQHWWAQAAGPNWAMLPHTAGFVDPLHSTGIAHTLCGIERLLDILRIHWGSPSLTHALEQYDHRIHTEIDHIDRLVSGCYRVLDNFELFTAFSMLYFAAAITYEEDRLKHQTEGTTHNRYFLCADDDRIKDIIDSSYHHLLDLLDSNLTPESIADFISETEQRIAPYNSAGLFRPRIRNMYEYTATL